jgi:hypothetical protein
VARGDDANADAEISIGFVAVEVDEEIVVVFARCRC